MLKCAKSSTNFAQQGCKANFLSLQIKAVYCIFVILFVVFRFHPRNFCFACPKRRFSGKTLSKRHAGRVQAKSLTLMFVCVFQAPSRRMKRWSVVYCMFVVCLLFSASITEEEKEKCGHLNVVVYYMFVCLFVVFSFHHGGGEGEVWSPECRRILYVCLFVCCFQLPSRRRRRRSAVTWTSSYTICLFVCLLFSASISEEEKEKCGHLNVVVYYMFVCLFVVFSFHHGGREGEVRSPERCCILYMFVCLFVVFSLHHGGGEGEVRSPERRRHGGIHRQWLLRHRHDHRNRLRSP